ncbi:site-specific integrase [Arthrospiribacter ruber]|jgi:site-specific recombinase XerD|uniref:Site-specific integrase n=1 Tax=Arthrospiribacter ruber TaxID=2487934 RepID=A0A951J216_9BACT|nr:site-specific integrase [Arthrospiribacter ruber]MBW3470369.1 site-specific integrase [Arthrospiribacter ruber]
MIEKSFSILFYLKGSKNKKRKEKHVYVRITVDYKRVELSTKVTCEPCEWNSAAGRVKGKSEKARLLNGLLDSYQMKIYQARKQLMDLDKDVTAERIKNMLIGKAEDRRLILEIFESHNQDMEALVGNEFAPGTMERYRTSLEHTRSFIRWKYGKDDMELKYLDYEFISQYSFWLKSVRGCAHNTTVKYLANFKKIVLNCVKNGWLQRDPFMGFKMVKKEVRRETLSKEELKNISEKDFTIERLDQVRDIFVFSCYTGLAYIDVKNLKRTQIIIGIDGEKWIETKRQKTEAPIRIPILPVALRIIEKYKDHPKCIHEDALLPVPSNQKMNAYLKEIADLCGVRKELTFHIARHTFATTITLSNGVPIETVSKLLGHRSLKQTQHYAKILDGKISEDMLALKSKLDK